MRKTRRISGPVDICLQNIFCEGTLAAAGEEQFLFLAHSGVGTPSPLIFCS
jgi:hypothetical protein